uniref:Secreted protein n=2 Tax=Populus TaxID=3689 RepID=A0A4U5QQH9_POPAL|nr:hypothetical protein D5086_0000054670 [Populus alba]
MAFIFAVMFMVGSCTAAPRREMIGGVYGQEQRQHVGKGKKIEGRTSKVHNPDRNIDNHHSIPRQNYDDWGAGSSGSSQGDNGDDGSGFLQALAHGMRNDLHAFISSCIPISQCCGSCCHV